MSDAARLSWPRALGLAALVVYGPFLGLAIYGSLFLECDHCRAGLWTVLPAGPGLIPLEFAGNGWFREVMPEALEWTFHILASLIMVGVVAWLARRARRWRAWTLAVALVVCVALAYGVLLLMRM